jgi:methyl-accepting chemotaxis protein
MKIKLTGRLVLSLLLVGLIPLLILAALSLRSTARIAENTESRLDATAAKTLDTIERNLFERYGDVQAFATNHVLFKSDPSTEAGRAEFIEAINTYVRLYGIYRLGIVTDAEGRCVAVNTRDFSGRALDTSFLLGRDFSSASWFKDARDGRFLKSDLLDGTVVEDAQRDPDSIRAHAHDHLTIGYSAPIRSPDGRFLGVWRNLADYTAIVEAIIQTDWATLAGDEGLRSTYEFTLISRDGVLLTDYDPHTAGTLDLHPDPTRVLNAQITREHPELAPALEPGARGRARYQIKDGDSQVIAGFANSRGALGYAGLGWSLLLHDTEKHLHADVIAANRATYITVGVAALLLVGVAFLIARSLTRPIQACVGAMERLAQGDLTVQLGLKRADELGDLSRSIDTSIAGLRDLVGNLGNSSGALVSSAQALKQTATGQAAAAEQTTTQAHTVATAGEQLSANAKAMSDSATQITQSTTTVAAAMEEMSSSIQEVARNCAQESEIARKADEQARQTREQMARLEDSARQIGKVVDLINRIAEQTNLLALNAAIEAASAGEAGRGFAVVANEVKELARQSAAATEDIRKQVDLIQQNAGSSMKSLDEVAKVIEQVAHIASSIAAAVEQQSATTSEIVGTINQVSSATSTLSHNVSQTAEGAAEVARNISGVSQAASDVARSASHTSTSASELDTLSATLRQLVQRFKTA